MIHIENKIPFATTTTTSSTQCCSFCSKPGHDIRNCNDIMIEDQTKKETQESKRREKLLKKINIANDINDMMTFSKKLKLR
jgi:hypothetical protein